MGSLPLQGGQLPCHRPRNMGLHLWTYEQKCDRRTRQMARTHANPYRCLSSSPRSSLCFCWLLPPRHSSKGGRELNSGVQFWTVGKIARSFSHSNSFHYVVATNDVFFQESSHHDLGDAFVGSGFHTVGKVIDGHQDILMSIWGFEIMVPMTSIPQTEKGHDTAYTCRVTTAPKVHGGKQILLNIIS